MRLTLVMTLLGSIIVTTGCTSDHEAALDVDAAVRDSAGIHIVENGDPERAPEWRIEPIAVTSIGREMGDPALELHEVTGVLVLRDGSVAVANTGTHEVRVYSPDGRPRLAVGGAGKGPGEFDGEIQLAHMPGDSILAFDWTLRRATVIEPSGGVARTIDLRHLDPNVDLRGVLADGTILLSMRNMRLVEGLNEDSVVFVRTDARGAPIDWPGWARFSRVLLRIFDGMPVADNLPFGPRGSAAATAEGLVIADGATAGYVVRGDAGRPLLIVRWDASPIGVTQDMIDRFREWDGGIPRNYIGPATRERWIESIEFPVVAPATSSLLVDGVSGRILVQAWRPPWEPGDAPWLVFAPDGRLIARMGVPPGLDVRAASGDLVAGLERDALDVERVRVYRIDGAY